MGFVRLSLRHVYMSSVALKFVHLMLICTLTDQWAYKILQTRIGFAIGNEKFLPWNVLELFSHGRIQNFKREVSTKYVCVCFIQ